MRTPLTSSGFAATPPLDETLRDVARAAHVGASELGPRGAHLVERREVGLQRRVLVGGARERLPRPEPVGKRAESGVRLGRPPLGVDRDVGALLEVVHRRDAPLLVGEEPGLLRAVRVLAAEHLARDHRVDGRVLQLLLEVPVHHVLDELEDVDPDVIDQLEDPHGADQPVLADPVDHVGRLDPPVGLREARHLGEAVHPVPDEVAVPDEPRHVVRRDQRLAEALAELGRGSRDVVPRPRAADDLDELLHRRRVVEVVADDPPVEPRVLVQEADRHRGGVGEEERVGGAGGLELLEHLDLDRELLDDRLEDEVRALRGVKVGARPDDRVHPVDEVLDDLAVLDEVLAVGVEPSERDRALLRRLHRLDVDVLAEAREPLRAQVHGVQPEGLSLVLGQERQPGHLLREQQRDAAPHLPGGSDHGDQGQSFVEIRRHDGPSGSRRTARNDRSLDEGEFSHGGDPAGKTLAPGGDPRLRAGPTDRRSSSPRRRNPAPSCPCTESSRGPGSGRSFRRPDPGSPSST